MTSQDIAIQSTNFSVDKYGNTTMANANITGGEISLSSTGASSPKFYIRNPNNQNQLLRASSYDLTIDGERTGAQLNLLFLLLQDKYTGENSIHGDGYSYYKENDTIKTEVSTSGIITPRITQTSLAEHKKNFERMQDNALETIKNIDIYKYNLKNEKDTDKKHIGFVIGDNYNYSKEVTSIDNKGVDNYSFTSLCCKAIQEQQEEIEKLQKENQQKDEILANLIERLEKLEKEANNGQD